MNPNAQKWVEALESGEFEQGKRKLQTGDAFCCLGVACVVYERETGERLTRNSIGSIYGTTLNTSVGGGDVREWLGLRKHHGAFDGGILIDLNDKGKTFPEIAAIIRSEPKGLFVEEGE